MCSLLWATLLCQIDLFISNPQFVTRHSAYPVRVKVEPAKPDSNGRQRIDIIIALERGCVIYANPVGNRELESVATSLTFVKGVKSGKVVYPKGEARKDVADWDYRVYKGTTLLSVTIEGVANPSDVEFRLFVWPYCEERDLCFPQKHLNCGCRK